MSGVKFLFENYISTDILANSDVSSEQSAFPVVNAYNLGRRSKVWRSNGYFNITALNNGLVLRDSNGGPDKLASIAIGEYHSTTSFRAAVKAAIEAVSAHTYTVSQTLTKKFSIATNHTYLELRFGDALSTIASVMGYDTVNLSGSTTYTADEIKIATSEWVKWDMGIGSKPNAFAMTGPRNSPLKFSPSSQIVLKGNFTDPISWANPVFQKVLDPDDEVMAHITEEDFYDLGLRFWRLEFMDVGNPLGYIEVGAFFLGRWFDRGCPQFPLNSQLIDPSNTQKSEGGQSFTDIFPQTQEYSLEYLNLRKEDVEEFEFWWAQIGLGKSFFVSLDNNEIYSTKSNRKLKYCKFAAQPKWVLETPPDIHTLSVDLREEL